MRIVCSNNNTRLIKHPITFCVDFEIIIFSVGISTSV